VLLMSSHDAAGKRRHVKSVMSGVNPQGCQVYSFKAPSARSSKSRFHVALHAAQCLSASIGIFNRSYYEELLVVRVHPEFLNSPKAAAKRPQDIWIDASDDITNIESSSTTTASWF